MLKHGLQLLVVHALEERFAAQNHACLGLRVADSPWTAVQVQGPDREGDGDVLTFEFVPDVGPNRVADIVVESMVPHRELDLVDDSGIGEIHYEDFDRWIRENAL